MERRLSLLKASEFLNWPNIVQRKIHPIPEPVVWLDWKGALLLAGQFGLRVEKPKSTNEYKLRRFERTLRARGFYWLREPRWSQLRHDLFVTDIRFWVRESLKGITYLSFEEWINESAFRIQTDYIDYRVRSRDGEITTRRKGVIPDGFFSLVDERRKAKSEPFRARFLLELDMSTHDNPSFGLDKAAPGAVYIKSPQYKERFESNSGRWLVVTTGTVRMRNLLIQTRARAGTDAHMFYFTTMDQMPKNNFFLDPIWRQPNSEKYVALLPN